MPEYTYKAKDTSGKTVAGHRFSLSRTALVADLEGEMLTVISIKEVPKKESSWKGTMAKFSTAGKRVKMFDLVIFCRQLATMLQGGVPILNAIESIASETKNQNFRQVLIKLAEDVRRGKTLSESINKYPRTFSVLFSAIVEAGEKVGALDEMLQRLSRYLEARDRLARKMLAATTYPAFIAGFFFVAVGVITLFLIPRFKSIYSDFGAELPTFTLIVFRISNFFVKNLAFILIVSTGLIAFLFIYIKQTRNGRAAFDRFLLKLPLFGEIIKKSAISKFCRTLSTLLGQGVSVTESLLLVGRTAGNVIIEDATRNASRLIVEGESIAVAFTKMDVFPPLMLQMTAVGVESGSLPELLDKTADFYEDQVDSFISSMTAMIEPILVISLGAVIAVVVLALYMPIFSLGSAMGGH